MAVYLNCKSHNQTNIRPRDELFFALVTDAVSGVVVN